MTEAGKPAIDSGKLNPVVAEYIRRREAGEEVDVESLCEQHPDLAGALRSYAAGEGLVEALAGDPDPSVIDSAQTQDAETIRPGVAQRTDLPDQKKFGKYELIRTLGEGAMGAIYLARDTNLDREVALKIPKFTGGEGPEFRQRFSREARAAAKLDHPQICRVYDADEIDGTPYITMAFLDGLPLSRFVGTPDFQDERRVAEVVRDIATGLAHAHEQGVLHRDLKPGNVMMISGGTPCVTDFGLARHVDSGEESRLTHEGTILGTPAYMSPEQIEADPDKIGPATDIYALGVILYELLASRLPFTGSLMSILGKALRDRPTPLCKLRPEVNNELEDLCLQMLEKSPEKRPASMREVADRLQAWLDKNSPESHAAEAKTQRNIETLDVMKERILDLVQRGQFAAAVSGLEKMTKVKLPEAKEFRKWARAKLKEVKQAPKQLREGVPALIATAQQCIEHHDYAQAAQLLQEIPQDFRTEEAQQLLHEAIELQDEADLLLADLKDCEKRKQFQGIEGNLKRFLELKPGNKFAKRLHESLQTYSKVPWKQRKYRYDDRGRLQPRQAALADNWLLMGGVAFALVFGVAYLGITIYLKDDDQTVKVEVDEHWLAEQGGGLTLGIDGDDQQTLTGPGFEIKLSPEEHSFTVKSGDTIVHNPQTFTIEKQGRQVLRIDRTGMQLATVASDAASDLSDTPATSSSSVADVAWTDLFNGRDLSGWDVLESVPDPNDATLFTTHRPSVGGWDVRGDVLVCNTDKPGLLRTRREYGDFHLTMDFKLPRSGNSGIYIRTPATGHPSLTGMEVQLIDEDDPSRRKPNTAASGSIQNVNTATSKATKPVGSWNSLDIQCVRDEITIRINDVTVNRVDMTSNADLRGRPRRGYVGISNWRGVAKGSEFRNIRILELPESGSASTTLPNPGNGWTDLFNGRDLSGWTVSGDRDGWYAANGSLVSRTIKQSGNTRSWIRTNAEYTDFDLELDYRLPENGNSGVFLRVPSATQSRQVKFLEIQLLHDDGWKHTQVKPEQRNGSLQGLAAAQPRLPSSGNTWRKVRVRAVGPSIQVTVDGQIVVDTSLDDHTDRRADSPHLFRSSGHIALQRYELPVEFRNIRIRRLNFNGDPIGTASPSSTAPAAEETGWTDLFNGRDLSGWQAAVNEDWRVTGGVLTSDAGPRGALWTEQQYGDFEFDFEFKLSNGANSGVFLRYSSNTDGQPRGLEVQLLDDPNFPYPPGATRHPTGSLHGLAAPRRENYRTGQWNRMTIRNLGRTVTVTLNGQEILSENTSQLTIPENRRAAVQRGFGHIGLQTYGAGRDGTNKIEFRNLRIRRLNFNGDPVNAAAAPLSTPQPAAPKFPFPQDARFTDAKPVTAANAGAQMNAYPWISPDGLNLYWTREGPGFDSAIMQATRTSPDTPFGSVRTVLQPARLASVSPNGLEIVTLADGDGDKRWDDLCSARRASTSTPFTNPKLIAALAEIPAPKGSAFSDDGNTLLVLGSDPDGGRAGTIYRSLRSGPGAAWGPLSTISIQGQSAELDRLTWPSLAVGGSHLVFSFLDLDQPSMEWGGVADATSDPLTFTSPRPLLLDGKRFVTRGGRYCAATGELFYSHPTGDPPYREMQIYVAKAVP